MNPSNSVSFHFIISSFHIILFYFIVVFQHGFQHHLNRYCFIYHAYIIYTRITHTLCIYYLQHVCIKCNSIILSYVIIIHLYLYIYIHTHYMYRAIWTTPIPAPRSQQSVSQRSTYRTLGSDELRQRMNSHWDQGRLLVSCDLA